MVDSLVVGVVAVAVVGRDDEMTSGRELSLPDLLISYPPLGSSVARHATAGLTSAMGNSIVAYLEGIRLFNTGHYWLAHEQWEACWLACRRRKIEVVDTDLPEGDATLDEEMRFYQALIQAAAALVKWQQGNRRGVALNWAKSRARLMNLPHHYQGLDLLDLRERLDQLCAGESNDPPELSIQACFTSA